MPVGFSSIHRECLARRKRAPRTRLHGAVAILFLFLALIANATAALASHSVLVVRNVNLRSDPSTNHAPIRLLRPPDEIALLGANPDSSYFQVRTEDNEEGWVWSRNVRIVEDATGEGVTPPISGATAPVDAIDSNWEKPDPQSSTFTINGQSCGPTGDGGDTGTNQRKNRTDLPAACHAVTPHAVLALDYPHAGTSRTTWTSSELDEIRPFEGVALTVEGFLVALKPQTGGSGESCNCHMTGAAEVDWHIALTSEAGQGEEDAIVVETSPRVRKNHAGWTSAALKPWVDSADPVRISGWLMMDPAHRNHLGRYRATLWEIHPISKIEVFKDGAWSELN